MKHGSKSNGEDGFENEFKLILLILHSACHNGTDYTTLCIKLRGTVSLRAYFHSLPKRTPLEKVSHAHVYGCLF